MKITDLKQQDLGVVLSEAGFPRAYFDESYLTESGKDILSEVN